MNEMNEKEIRERLAHAVAPLDSIAPPLDLLRQRAVKLRRFRISAGGGLLAAAAAAVTVAVVVVPADGSQRVHATTAPSQASLSKYAAAHGGRHVAGPIGSGPFYGAFADKQGIEVAKYSGGAWHPDGTVTTYGPGRFVMRIANGGDLVAGSPSFVERYQGGDVSYYGGLFYDDHGTWKAARFGRCAQHTALSCAYAGTSEPYGHVALGSFESIHNDCTPYCAAGTNYVVTWKWSAVSAKFAVAKVTKYRVRHAR